MTRLAAELCGPLTILRMEMQAYSTAPHSPPETLTPAPPTRRGPPVSVIIAASLLMVISLTQIAQVVYQLYLHFDIPRGPGLQSFESLSSVLPACVSIVSGCVCAVWLPFGKGAVRVAAMAVTGAVALETLTAVPRLHRASDESESLFFLTTIVLLALALATISLLSLDSVSAWLRERRPQPATEPHSPFVSGTHTTTGRRPAGIAAAVTLLLFISGTQLVNAGFELVQTTDQTFADNAQETIGPIAAHSMVFVCMVTAAVLVILRKKVGWPLAIVASSYAIFFCVRGYAALIAAISLSEDAFASVEPNYLFAALVLAIPVAAGVTVLVLLGAPRRVDWFYVNPNAPVTAQQHASHHG